MEYRRFGKTEKKLSVITLGGMRFKHVWDDPRNEIPTDTQEHCNVLVDQAIKHGINHFETAYGYKKSETALGRTLNQELKIDRNSYYLMTKGNGHSASAMRQMVEEQLQTLQTDYFDFYAWHGINNDEILQQSCASGGAVEELLKLKEEGLIKHVGFSTHAPLNVITRTIETDLFEFVNLHYYYFFQRNKAAIQLAQSKDMGVFIISPNDKGGQLFKAPEKVRNAIPHATPIQWNARFCLRSPAVHTLSFGMTENAHFDEMEGIFPSSSFYQDSDLVAKQNLDAMIMDDPFTSFDGYNKTHEFNEINIAELLRLRKLWKCYDMLDFAKYRYKELREPNHWVPGVYATKENIDKIDLAQIPQGFPIKNLLEEAHLAFYESPIENHIKKIEPLKLKLI